MSDNWEGASPTAKGANHHTVGPHRARCFGCGYWCYPHDWCDCCHEAKGHRKVWIDKSGDVVENEEGQ